MLFKTSTLTSRAKMAEVAKSARLAVLSNSVLKATACAVLTVGSFLSFSADGVEALTLNQSFEVAYQNNPSLKAERAKTKASNEAVVAAIGEAFPSVSATFSSTWSYNNTYANHTDGHTGPGFLARIDLSQPLYRGGGVGSGVRYVEYNTQAVWAALHSLEQQVFAQVAQAYIAVLKEQALIKQYDKSVGVLGKQLEAAKTRFDVGEGTKTEIAQAETRLAQTRAQLASANAGLQSAKASYYQAVGQNIGSASSPAFPKGLPTSLDAAIEASTSFHPDVMAASLRIRSAKELEKVRLAAGRPSADLTASLLDQSRSLEDFHDTRTTSAQITASVRIPLYQGGKLISAYRQAKEGTREANYRLEQARGSLRQRVSTAWNNLSSARALEKALLYQKRAAETVLEGAELELEVGTKTFLDVLEAEKALQEAEVGLVRSQYDELNAAYVLVAALGRLSAEDLGLSVNRWEARDHYYEITKQFQSVYKFIGKF